MSGLDKKPEHNKYDNIWEIRQTGYPSEEEVQRVLTPKVVSVDEQGHVGKAVVFRKVEDFIYTVLHKHSIKLPIWKIVIPRLEGNSGAIYYIVECDDYNRIFRGTFGYFGTGPHESALIEAVFEKYHLSFEVRDGDYLLNFCEEYP